MMIKLGDQDFASPARGIVTLEEIAAFARRNALLHAQTALDVVGTFACAELSEVGRTLITLHILGLIDQCFFSNRRIT